MTSRSSSPTTLLRAFGFRLYALGALAVVGCGINVKGTASDGASVDVTARGVEPARDVGEGDVPRNGSVPGDGEVAADAGTGDTADAGNLEAAVPAQLLCKTYDDCPHDMYCCYTPGVGSSCAAKCDSGAASLCELGKGGCGNGRDCEPLASLPGVGECVEDD